MHVSADRELEEFRPGCPAQKRIWRGFKALSDAKYCSNAGTLDTPFKVTNECPIEARSFF